jgi:rRNA maturation endonuclease Nob1
MNQLLNEINKKYDLKPLRPVVGRCTGCNLKFDGEDYYCEDACDECGYQTCENCSADTSRGMCSSGSLRV